MSAVLYGLGFTIAALLFITAVFAVALFRLSSELSYVKALTDYLGYDLVAWSRGGEEMRPDPSLQTNQVREEVESVLAAGDPVWANKQIRGWQMRAQRLEPALAFWVDFLRQLGLLFTVLALGLSFSLERTTVDQLLAPLGLAVWTTVAGLAYSIWLSAQFGMKIPVWSDTCEKNIEAWNVQRIQSTRP